jgi:DNA replication and repair protein RecF
MFLRKLSVINFKNIAQGDFNFTSRMNCFVGGNGAGKTNILDAIHYLSMCRSALAMTDSQSVRHGEEFFVLDGDYTAGERRETVVCTFRRGEGKALKRNGKVYEKLSDHVGAVPVVVSSPSDTALVNDAAEERRRWLNGLISQLDRGYMGSLIRYNNILAERNRLLKTEGAGEILDILDMQLSEAGTAVWRRRGEIVRQLTPLVAEYYKVLSGDGERVELEYRSELDEAPMEEVLAAARERDRAMRFTTSGIHRDDLVMRIGGYALRKYGSQGQQKSFLVALKLAQYAVAADVAGRKPLLLLDDLFDKLDMERVGRLIGLVAGDAFGQIFITDCNKVRLEQVLAGQDYMLWNIEEGCVPAQ